MNKVVLSFLLAMITVSLWGQVEFATDPKTDVALADSEVLKTMDVFILANQKKLLGRYEDAVELYKQVLERDALNAAAHHDLARIYVELEDMEGALSAAKKAVRYNPKNHWYKMTLVQIYEQEMNHQAAADLIAQVITTHPSIDLYHRQADNLVKANQYQQAIAVYDQADAHYGIDEWRSDSKVDLYLQLKNEKAALAEVNKWTETYPDKSEFWVKLARYQEFRGNNKASVKAYQKALTIDPQNEEALYKTTQKEIKGKSNELMTLINNPKLGIDNKIATLMPLLQNSDQMQELETAASSLTQQYPDDPKAYALQGDIYWLQDKTEEAATSYEQSLSKNKSVYQVWDHYMQALALLDKNEELDQWSSEALDYYPNQAGPYFFQALVKYRNGKLEKVDTDLDEALFIAGSSDGYIIERCHMLRAQVRSQTDGIDQGLAYLATLKENVCGPNLLELWGDWLVTKGDATSAKEKYNQALKKGGNPESIKAKLSTL